MDDTTEEVIKNYEELLKKNAQKTTLPLYSSEYKNGQAPKGQAVLNPQDIITNLTSQLKAIQQADTVTSKNVRNCLTRCKKSSFVPVNMLPKDVLIPQPTHANKFETQFELDTQLMDVIVDAEELIDDKNGITQEFDSTFQIDDEEIRKQSCINSNLSSSSQENNGNSNNKEASVATYTIPNPSKEKKQEISKYYNDFQDLTQSNENEKYSDTLKINIDKKMVSDDIADDDLPCSYIFEPIKKSNTPSPLVFDLNSFEEFEKIAIPIIEEHPNIKSVKHLINSQIVGRELLIQTDDIPQFCTGDTPLSPVLQITADKLNVPKHVNSNNDTKNNDHNISVPDLMKDSVFLKDEIIFSSDEESEYIHKHSQDLPLTCALETSFYNQSQVLDKTMYVCFQTASNRSIQVCTESYAQAKNFLDDSNEDKNKATLTELVEMCDIPKKTVTNDSQKIANLKNTSIKIDLEEDDIFGDDEIIIKRGSNQKAKDVDKQNIYLKSIETDKLKTSSQSCNMAAPVKRKYDGFTTASNKKIKLSEQALARCQEVFQDMDLEDNLEQGNALKLETDVTDNIQNEISTVDSHQIDENILSEFNEEMPLIENKQQEVKECVGFKTDRNTNILISGTALAKSKKIFDDLNTFEPQDVNNLVPDSRLSKNVCIEDPLHPNIVSFKTASNNNIGIPQEDFVKSENILKEFIDIEVKDDIEINSQYKCLNWDQPTTSKQHVCDFKTASNKEICISSETLAKSRLFQDIIEDDSDFITEYDRYSNKLDLSHPNPDNYVDFRTANNNTIAISEEAYSRTKNMFNNISFCEEDIDKIEEESKKQDTDVKDTEVEFELQEMSKLQQEICDDFSKEFDNIVSQNTNVPNFCGFKTATNKSLKVSEKAMCESKKLFADLDLGNDFNCFSEDISIKHNSKSKSEDNIKLKQVTNITKSKTCTEKETVNQLIFEGSTTAFAGFKTASNKEVMISEKALAKSKQLFSDLELDNLEKDDKISVPKAGKLSSYNRENIIPNIQSFQTASRKPIHISDKALEKSKALFKDIDDEDISKNTKLEACKLQFKGFETANKKPIQISAQAMAKSLAIFKETENQDFIDKSLDSKGNGKEITDWASKKTTTFKGFKTASNKPVQISKEALTKSAALFQDTVDDNIPDTNQNNITYTTLDKKSDNNGPIFKDFETASRSPEFFSKEALAKSNALLKDIVNGDLNHSDLGQEGQDPDKEPNFRGFQTASKKPVKVSAESLAKSNALFKDIIKDEIYNPKELLDTNVESNFKGFQTASKKLVKISAESLAKSRALFKDIDNEDIVKPKICQEDKSVSPKESIFRGFETASLKAVQVSADALARSKLLFQDIDDCQTVDNTSKFHGFTSGNNKIVAVSDDMIKSKNLLDKGIGNEFSGFQTASKKKVLISEEAIKHSRLLFQDINDESPNTTNEYKKKEYCANNAQRTTFSFKSANNNRIGVSQDTLIITRNRITDANKNNNSENSLEQLIDTQVINNFEETLHTEDFCKDTTPRQSKRSGSPILSCPKPKRRKKFETPYRNEILTKSNIIPDTASKTESTYDTGMLFNEDYKKTKRYTLKDLADVEKNSPKPKPTKYSFISNYNFDTLLSFKFNGNRNDVTETEMSTADIKRIFLNNVNKKLIPDGWLDNHIKLVIWKLFCYEIKFPNTLSGVCTVKNVLDQIKYRYDKELYNAERPALRKILEKDDVASKTMVLCVAAVYVDGVSVSSVPTATSNIELLLTDGWYCIKATIDRMLSKLVYDERIRVGCKIVTNGAEMVNCELGVAPWEDTSSVRLKLFGNSTRRARWDSRLGYHGNAAILAPLSTVKVEGGKVSKLRLYVARVYPALFVEKFEDGSTVTRSERLETIHQVKYESERQAIMEKLYEEVEKELSDQESQDSESSYNNRRKLYNGSQLISNTQTRSLEERSNRRREKLIQDIQTKLQDKMEAHGLNVNRNVIPLLKVRVAGVEKDSSEVTKGLMSIWKPNDAITEIIREGIWIEVLNIVPTAVRYSEIQISAGRNSIFRESKFKASDKMLPYINNLKRKCYHIKELTKTPTISTDYNEIDTAGFIFQIDPKTADFETSKQPFQNMYLTDVEKNIICLNFWGGLKKFGYHNVLDTGQVVACVNLQKRSGNTKKNIPHYRVTEFSYFTKTPKNIEARNMVEELVKKFSGLDKRKYCEECIVFKNNFNKSVNYNNENISPYRINNMHNLTKNKMFIDSPLAQKPVDENLNLTGLDFESTFKQNTQDASPEVLLRRKKVNEKIAKLKMYGEPPPLSHIHFINKSKSALNSYKSPLTNVASAKKDEVNSRKSCSDIPSSPVLAMNRTFVKTVHPVKLNFSNAQDDTAEDVDHFAEEFDASPPLSLD